MDCEEDYDYRRAEEEEEEEVAAEEEEDAVEERGMAVSTRKKMKSEERVRPEQEDELVEWFRANEMFYDQTRRDFKDKQKKDRLLNVKGKEMGISGEYRLEYMPLMIQKKHIWNIV